MLSASKLRTGSSTMAHHPPGTNYGEETEKETGSLRQKINGNYESLPSSPFTLRRAIDHRNDI